MSIVVFGSINIDVSVYSDRLPKPGETLHGNSYAIGLGGKGCNQAVAVRRLGGEVNLIGRTGDDEFSAAARRELATHNVSDGYIASDPETATGMATISIDSAGENSITVVGGANMAISASDVDACANVFTEAQILLLQLEIPMSAMSHAASVVRQSGGRVILDPAPAPEGGFEDTEIFSCVDFMTPNENETEALVGIRPASADDAAVAAQRLYEKGLQGAIIKLGARGVYYSCDGVQGFVPPFAVEVIDSVAAGDCFNGGLAFALARGDDVASAVGFAAACGALATTRPGAASAAPSLDDVNKLMIGQVTPA